MKVVVVLSISGLYVYYRLLLILASQVISIAV